MNKYEIAGRLAERGLTGKALETFFEIPETVSGSQIILALRELIDGYRKAAQDFQSVALAFATVLAEIEAAEKPEPASDDAPCAFISTVLGFPCNKHKGSVFHDCKCESPHYPLPSCHPYQPASTVRYASGEEPMVGDRVIVPSLSKTEEREVALLYTSAQGIVVMLTTTPSLQNGLIEAKACLLVRRANAPTPPPQVPKAGFLL